MRHLWLIAACLAAPLASASEKAPTLGVGELSCSKEIDQSLCAALTEKLVSTLEGQSAHAVVRQAEARRKQRACEQDAICLKQHRPTYARIISGSVRVSEEGVEVSLRLLDARRMEKLSEGTAHAPSPREEELLASVETAAKDLLSLQDPAHPGP